MEDVRLGLPGNIQLLLSRKSSRDPSSRFTSKLYALLKYVDEVPSAVDEVGVSWIDEDTFKMNKRTLSTLMSIKLNTLNVNLRDLGFRQQKCTQEGWTRWTRQGFTRSALTCVDENPLTPYQTEKFRGREVDGHRTFAIGNARNISVDQFFASATAIWNELTVGAPGQVDARKFLRQAGERFREDGQTLENAIAVLTAIITPTQAAYVTFPQFAKFMAMFGPERTVMLKIASLLEVAHRTGDWLCFDVDQPVLPQTYAAFSDTEPNCLVVHAVMGISRIWNDPGLEAAPRVPYLMDESGNGHVSWGDYFAKHPFVSRYNPH